MLALTNTKTESASKSHITRNGDHLVHIELDGGRVFYIVMPAEKHELTDASLGKFSQNSSFNILISTTMEQLIGFVKV